MLIKGTFFYPAENQIIIFFLQVFYNFPLWALGKRQKENVMNIAGKNAFFLIIFPKIWSGTKLEVLKNPPQELALDRTAKFQIDLLHGSLRFSAGPG